MVDASLRKTFVIGWPRAEPDPASRPGCRQVGVILGDVEASPSLFEFLRQSSILCKKFVISLQFEISLYSSKRHRRWSCRQLLWIERSISSMAAEFTSTKLNAESHLVLVSNRTTLFSSAWTILGKELTESLRHRTNLSFESPPNSPAATSK